MPDIIRSKSGSRDWGVGRKETPSLRCGGHDATYGFKRHERVPAARASNYEVEQAFADGVQAGIAKAQLALTQKALRNILHDALRDLATKWVQERFDRLAAEWKRETLLLSKVSAMTSHIAYLKIIGMGQAAVPCILRDLRDNGPHHWFLALYVITEENPVPKDKVGNVTAMTEAWLQWGRRKGYLNNSHPNTAATSPTLASTR